MVEAAPAGPAPLRRTFLVPEIKSLDQYDFSRAKAAASLAWVLRAAFGGAEHVPPELWEPFYTDQYAQEHVKPPVTRLLLSAELYCRAWRQALPQLEAPPNPSALLALLSRRGTVPSLPDRPVREADLRHQPIVMGAHLAVIDALMVAFAFEWTKTLPGPLALPSLEHKLLFWVETTVRRLQEKTEQEAAQRASPAAPADGAAPAQPSCPTRWYWKLVPHAIAFCLKESGSKPPMIRYRKDRAVARRAPCFPSVTTIQDLASGAALAATIHCYCPQLLRLEEVCLKDPMSVADSLYNLQLVQDFCASRLPRGCPLSLEDLLYVPPPLKVNLVVLLAEMFTCFEVLKPDFVQAKDLPDGHATSPWGTEASPSQNNSGSSSPVFNFRHPLLSPGGSQSPLRGSTGSLKSSPSMSHMEALGKAWNRQLSRPLSQAVSFSTPFGLDSDVDVVMGDPVLLRSVSSDSLGPPRPVPAARTPAQPTPEPGDLPTIEEALQIIHSAEPRLLPDGAADGSFYLHSPEGTSKPPLSSSYPPMGASKLLSDGLPKAPVYVPHPETPSKPSPCPAREVLKPPASAEGSPKAVALSPAATNSEVKMTSFAERKKQLVKAEEAGVGSPTSTPAAPEALSSEMSELGARLEEKRRAIEAQKRRIEAIFAKHRQRLGKSAFLQVQPREAAGEAEAEAEAEPAGGGRPAGEGQGEPSSRTKSVTFSAELGPETPEGLGDYNRAVSKLSAALSSLQRDMQRLTDQQQRLLAPPEAPGPAPPPAAWVIPGPTTGSKAASPSPARRAPAARRSPGPGPSPTSRSPKHTRPAELRLAPLTRVLTPPNDVDSLPHLRKFSPSQVPVQTRSSILLAEETPPEEPAARPGLIEIPLASLGEPAAEEDRDGSPPGAEDSLEEEASSEGEPRTGLGFFYKDEDKPEDEMAQKRASLLERQQRRAEEARKRKQWQEAEKEQRREEAVRLAHEEAPAAPTSAPTAPVAAAAAVAPAPAARVPAEEEAGPRRGEFTRLEYERRAQLKLMDDLEKVLRPRAAGAGGPGRGGRRAPRPRSGCCDDSALARSPARGLLGSRLSKVYSQSTLSLSTVANETPHNLGVKRSTSRAPSPSGLMSPSRLQGTREREWENGSNASSPASVPEYTGPRLYKEPSAKSNKFIIHNALSHCCLAGKVNEPQKNRILEEIEKSKANHFLILFRDSSCQFRALYTLSGETEELSRLTGYGPRTVTPAMVEGIYKYNSDRKRFTQIPAKTMSMSVDAFTIQGHLWQSKKPTTPKKGGGTPK
ncbi:PREDICTED: calmodulin-regulated spectrin-associated protein 3 [Chinchilla lanigera]|uniref:calmodulin-regulated spectrin-associated protein 3 n=1 Tax=Chinchilla lanigera TaxID=34839 RepID=UPI000698ABFA|nr:PREDICTED: calmodulin-regulated spectrin-associated protein 3 [Chinchilla lanigera]